MFHVEFDDFKRKLAAKPEFPYVAEKIETCYKDTPTYDLWWNAYMAEGSDIQITATLEHKLVTFYKLVKKDAVK